MTIIEHMQKISEVGMAMTMLLSHLSRATRPPDERDRAQALELIHLWDELWKDDGKTSGDGEMRGDCDNPRDA